MTNANRKIDAYAGYGTWKQWDEEPFGSFTRKQHYYFRKLTNFYPEPVSNNVNVLEIGFGNGAFAGWLKMIYPHISWTGIEIQDALVSKAQKAGFNAILANSDKMLVGQYDLIIALDVIEHLTDQEIEAFFSDALAKLKLNGVILTRTPNGGGPFGLPNQTGDSTHITPISLSRLSGYLTDWQIEEKGDMQPLWEGNVLSAIRNCIRLFLRTLISVLIRFAFAPQPKTLLASNLHLRFKPKG